MKIMRTLRAYALALLASAAATATAGCHNIFPTPTVAGISTMMLLTDGSVLCFEHVNGQVPPAPMGDNLSYGNHVWSLPRCERRFPQ